MPPCYNPAQSMDQDKIQALLHARASADQELERMRSPVTILFSDIKGSTAYFEKKGDVEGLAMVQRHNELLIPIIEDSGGVVVKTIGDAIMARFNEPVYAVRAAVDMQRALESDRIGKPPEEQIHVKIGLHTGLGLIKEDDVYGDVVNAASRVQNQAKPDQILITDVLLDAARSAGVQCAKLGRAEMRGKDELIDLYVVAWSQSNNQLIEEIEARFEGKLKEAKRQHEEIEEEYESARGQWRSERRRLVTEIEELEQAIEEAKETARSQVSEDVHSEIRFQLEQARRARQQTDQELAGSQMQWERERTALKQQIATMQTAALEAMERSNNPTRVALAVREQVDSRLSEARHDWELQWESERRRLHAEIDRLKNRGDKREERKEAARRTILQKLGRLPAGENVKSNEDWRELFEQAKVEWETQRDQLQYKVKALERDLEKSADGVRSEIFQELRAQYKPKLEELRAENQRLQREMETLQAEHSAERQTLNTRIVQLERAIPEAQEATRKQVTAELQADFDSRFEEVNRAKIRSERRFQDDSEEWESELRRARKQIADMEEQLKEARGAAFKAQRTRG
jgi:class 3 adenylate cyclase